MSATRTDLHVALATETTEPIVRKRRMRRFYVAARAASFRAAHRMQCNVRQLRVHTADLPASVLLLLVAIALPIVTFLAAFSITDRVTHGEIWRTKGYFLSAAIDVEPASNFGSLGLTISLAAFMGVAVVRYHVVAERIRFLGLEHALGRLHAISLGCGLTAAFGGNGVAAFQHRANRHMHNGFAACFVLCALAHFYLESKLERRAGLSSRLARATRLSLVMVAAAGCATFITHVVLEESRHLDLGIGKLRAACAEIATCACFLIYLATYSRSFHETRITITVTVPPAKASSAVQASALANMPPARRPSKPTSTTAVAGTLAPKIRKCSSASAALGALALVDNAAVSR